MINRGISSTFYSYNINTFIEQLLQPCSLFYEETRQQPTQDSFCTFMTSTDLGQHSKSTPSTAMKQKPQQQQEAVEQNVRIFATEGKDDKDSRKVYHLWPNLLVCIVKSEAIPKH
jgi:hypothetical protein